MEESTLTARRGITPRWHLTLRRASRPQPLEGYTLTFRLLQGGRKVAEIPVSAYPDDRKHAAFSVPEHFIPPDASGLRWELEAIGARKRPVLVGQGPFIVEEP